LGDAANNYTNNKDEIFKRIHVVPNPYYAYSEYEGTRVETKVRIINLPDKANIKIYTLDGALIKSLVKNDNKTTYVDWDIKNDKGIPIASGMYLVHVSIPGVGETVLKWFGAMRPIDLISF
jgi:flagellar hook assembly protein FlgD